MSEKNIAVKKWDDEAVEQLISIVSGESPVSSTTVEKAAEALGVSIRSVASKLRNMDIEVASMAKVHVSAFSPEETTALAAFVTTNSGTLTYKGISEAFAGGKFNAKQVQGKILSLELTEHVKPTEKVETVRTYSPEEETKFIKLVEKGAFIEDIAVALGKSVQSVRGKALSMLRQEVITNIPQQKESHAKETVDGIQALGDKITSMTVEEIAEKTNKTTRGIRTALTRRGIKVANYDGAAKRAKADSLATSAV